MDRWIPSEEETFAQIGCLLLLTQQAEYVTSNLIGIVYPNNVPSWEELEELNRQTLGTLVRTLQKRVDIHPGFEGLLNHFVKGRNLFIHRLSAQPYFDMHSEAGRDEIWNFLERYQKVLQEILMVVTSTVFKHAETSGMAETKWHDELRRRGFLQEIKEYDLRSQVAFRRRKP